MFVVASSDFLICLVSEVQQQPPALMPQPLIDLAIVAYLDFRNFFFHFGHSIWHHVAAFVILIVFSHFDWIFRRRCTNCLLQL